MEQEREVKRCGVAAGVEVEAGVGVGAGDVDECSRAGRGSCWVSLLVNMNECCLHVACQFHHLPRSPLSLYVRRENPYELTTILFMITRSICFSLLSLSLALLGNAAIPPLQFLWHSTCFEPSTK